MSDFAGNSAKLAVESIRNSRLREHYIEITKTTADCVLEEARNAELLSPCQQLDVWKGAALKASKMRNIWMDKTRERMSPTALAFSKLLKDRAPTFSELVNKYTSRLYESTSESSFEYLTDSNKMKVFQTIVKSAGRTNTTVNIVSKVAGVCGALSLLVTFAVVLYGIGSSRSPSLCVARYVITFGTGIVGAYLGSKLGAKVALYFGFRPVTVFVLTIVCGLVVGVSTALVSDVIMTYVLMALKPEMVKKFSMSLIC